jgi:hypothetical protein
LQQIVSQPYSGAPDILSQSPATTSPTPVDTRTRDALRTVIGRHGHEQVIGPVLIGLVLVLVV